MSSVKIEEEYISLTKFDRIFWSSIASLMNFLIISGLLDAYTLHWIVILKDVLAVSVGFVVGITAVFLTFLFMFRIETFVVWLSRRWSFRQLLRLERIVGRFMLILLAEFILMVLYQAIVSPLHQWIHVFVILQMLIFFNIAGFSSLFTRRGKAILYLEQFVTDHEKDSSRADFKYLKLGSENIARWLKNYGILVSASSLAFGMTLASLENRRRKDMEKIINGLKNPYDSNFFRQFRSSIQNFLLIAEKSHKKGIREKSRFITYDRFIDILRYIAVPFLVAFSALAPELMKMLEA